MEYLKLVGSKFFADGEYEERIANVFPQRQFQWIKVLARNANPEAVKTLLLC